MTQELDDADPIAVEKAQQCFANALHCIHKARFFKAWGFTSSYRRQFEYARQHKRFGHVWKLIAKGRTPTW
jgi:hypothetical protein